MSELKLDEEWFWNLIQRAIPPVNKYSINEHKKQLLDALAALPNDQLFSFARIHNSFYMASYNARLWNAGYIISNGMGDDDFSDFRNALIAFGKLTYEQVLKDPESLAAFPLTEYLVQGETFSYLVHEALEEHLNEDDAFNAMNGVYQQLPELEDEAAMTEDPAALKQLYPLLFAKFWKL